jgi:hypothetical protein
MGEFHARDDTGRMIRNAVRKNNVTPEDMYDYVSSYIDRTKKSQNRWNQLMTGLRTDQTTPDYEGVKSNVPFHLRTFLPQVFVLRPLRLQLLFAHRVLPDQCATWEKRRNRLGPQSTPPLHEQGRTLLLEDRAATAQEFGGFAAAST